MRVTRSGACPIFKSDRCSLWIQTTFMTMKLTPAQLDRIRKFLPAHRAQALSVLVEPAQRLELASGLRALRDGISAYLPRYLVQVIQGNPVPGQVGCYFKTGTVMFADVSGFTAMSEKLSDLGKEGAEEMTGIVNAYFEAMLEISEALQGDLLKFGGDALMIFFGGDGSEPRALAASNAMQAAMGQFAQVQTSQGIFPLRMSIGMASGPIILLNLGSADEMYFTVMGRTLGRMAQMEERANAAQVVVDGQTAEACRELASFKKIAEGTFLLTATTGAGDPPALDWISAEDRARKSDQPDDLLGEITHLEALSPYIPDELLVRLVADPNHPVRRGSHRPVTNMFANFAGLDAWWKTWAPGGSVRSWPSQTPILLPWARS
jgi:class 3 adenylate cyclase